MALRVALIIDGDASGAKSDYDKAKKTGSPVMLDLNGDGALDLQVGATAFDSTSSGAGAAFLLYGPVIGAQSLGAPDVTYQGGNVTVLLLDNRSTAMTGGQNNPANGRRMDGSPAPRHVGNCP